MRAIPLRPAMEVLLLQDVHGIGKKNDLLVVGDGFALNYLLPRRKALVATPTVRKRYAEQIRRRAEEKERERALLHSAASALAGKTLEFTRNATKTGKLYAAVSAEDIVEKLRQECGIELPAASVEIDAPIKTLGTAQVKLLLADTTQIVPVIVKAEKATKGA